MPLADLTRAAVEQAMREHDRLGRADVVGRDEIDETGGSFLLHGGRTYDCMAVAADAHRLVRPGAAPLRADALSGGAATVAARLRALGFTVIRPGDALASGPLPPAADEDTRLRMAAFEHVRRLGEVHDHLTARELKPGFVVDGERIPLVSAQRGIFKPRRMRFLLSIRTVFPRPGGRVWYDDQREVHRQIFAGDESVDYAFMGQDPDAADNRWLREAFENQVPVIYFLGIAPGRYQAMLPTFIVGWDAATLKARIAFGVPDQSALAPPETALERRYALRQVKQRLHQASFREAVISAYGGRCAISRLPESRLLDAAHIVADTHERFGQPIVSNGLPLSKIHHAAFDAHLIGIDPDYRLHVAERLLAQNDGPMLEGLKRLDGGMICTPRRSQDKPDRDRLALRFERFKAVA